MKIEFPDYYFEGEEKKIKLKKLEKKSEKN